MKDQAHTSRGELSRNTPRDLNLNAELFLIALDQILPVPTLLASGGAKAEWTSFKLHKENGNLRPCILDK